MPNDFKKIPPVVWKLFDEIMWISYRRRTGPKFPEPLQGGPVKLLRGPDRAHAEIIAQGWDPPLLDPRHPDHLTAHGLAAYCWHEQQSNGPPQSEPSLIDQACLVLTPQESILVRFLGGRKYYTDFDTLAGVPDAFRDNTPSDGAILAKIKKIRPKLLAAGLPMEIEVSGRRVRLVLHRS